MNEMANTQTEMWLMQQAGLRLHNTSGGQIGGACQPSIYGHQFDRFNQLKNDSSEESGEEEQERNEGDQDEHQNSFTLSQADTEECEMEDLDDSEDEQIQQSKTQYIISEIENLPMMLHHCSIRRL